MGELLLFCRLEMSSSLERDYDEFEFSRENQLEEANVEEKFQKLGECIPYTLYNIDFSNLIRLWVRVLALNWLRYIGTFQFYITKVGNEFQKFMLIPI